MSEAKWIQRWNTWIAPKPAREGIWRRKEGGYIIRGRTIDPRTKRRVEVRRVLQDATLDVAVETLHAELKKIRVGTTTETPVSLPLWSEYAASLLEAKVADGSIRARHTRATWQTYLKHHLVPAFGLLRIDKIRRADVVAFKNRLAQLVKRGTYSPVTANNILRLFGTITTAAWDEHEIDRRNPGQKLPYLNTRDHVVYTEEEPNALTVDEMRTFLALMLEHWPQHFAMVALGFGTGLRPSSLRPIRRSGPVADVKWGEGRLLVRRSHTGGDEVMESTKTARRYSIPLPPEMMEILTWHVDEQLPADGPMHESELLFPSTTGGFRSTTCLKKPFDDIARKRMKLTKHITPRAMRRTFQDLARQAQIHDVVTRAISGHATEEMQRHYSTAQSEEIRAGLSRVVSLAGFREALAAGRGMHRGMHEGETTKTG